MRVEAGELQLSASDLVGFLNCKHLSAQDLRVAEGELTAPMVFDPMLETLRERGAEHERDYINHLREAGLDSITIAGIGIDATSVSATTDAMRAGVAVIVQAALADGIWRGRADVLLRVDRPSELGAWSYEVVDTKLARQTKAGTVLQLSLYSELLAGAQGLEPEYMHVVMPWSEFEPESWRVADFSAYFRRVRGGLSEFVAANTGSDTYPEPNPHCDVCRWNQLCAKQRRGDDHLCLVAGISKVQRTELAQREVTTTAALAAMPIPLTWKPTQGSASSLVRVREQARVQIESRESGELKFELLPIELGFGLTVLPSPSEGDVFLDFEADPFVGQHGIEYLCGFYFKGDPENWEYRGLWALTAQAEREAFEQFIDFIVARRMLHPDLHIYHYGGYEAGALKRLAGRYATREDELDQILRGKVLVDLLNVVRQGVRAGVESYSIKRLEPLYDFEREAALADANIALRQVETALELRGEFDDTAREIVQRYNKDDCVSTLRLRNWLEGLRAGLIATGTDVPRPHPSDETPSDNVSAWLLRIEPIVKALTANVPEDDAERSEEQRARWTLAHLLDWHRREAKSGWWEYFRLSALTADDLFDERSALSGLELVGTVGGTARCPIHRYKFPPQEADVRAEKKLKTVGGEEIGDVDAISLDDLTIDIKKRQNSADTHPAAVFVHEHVSAQTMMDALVRLAEYVVEHGLQGTGPHQAARELLLRRPATLTDGSKFRNDGETTLQAALRIAGLLDGGSLPIQGPPGTGKTFTGARMVCELVRRGKKVGIVANSHAVIRNFVDCVREAADQLGPENLKCVQKPKVAEANAHRLRIVDRNPDIFAALADDCQVAAGTAWLWSTPAAYESVDVLFVDEAAQMALANVLAVAQATRSIVMLGDPQQLDQPTQGSHPDGTASSALDHVLNGQQTIDPRQGLFLDQTWRLHPKICAFTSEVFYEGKLQPRAGLERQSVSTDAELGQAGLRYVPVHHFGNQNSAPEEAAAVAELVNQVLASGATWTDSEGNVRTIGSSDFRIITPYNAQVFEIQKLLPSLKIGTVDKFQGQEAVIAIYSLATSSHADAPRGMEFLYSLNRLNVATSRAKCVSVLVATPAVFECDCHSPRQMQLANAFCRFQEMASLAT